jgi:acyl-CoA thioester hydrolase
MISRLDIQLRYSDSDQMGVIYHANYFSFYEQGRTKYLKDLGYEYSDVEKNGIIFPIREVSGKFIKSITYGENIHLLTRVHKLTKVKTTYFHEILNDQGELKATGYTTVVCVDKATFKVIKMDERMPEIYEAYLKDSQK